jgi:hypothetical protein
MIGRKLVSAIMTLGIVLFFFMLLSGPSFTIFFGMYVFPFLLLYGMPSSIMSDVATCRLTGLIRMGLAFVMHIIFAVLFVAFLRTWENDRFYVEFQNLYSDVLFIITVLIASLFWCFDEILRREGIKEKWHQLVKRMGNLRM